MSSARQLFRLNLGLAAVGSLAAAAALLVGLRSVELARPPLGQLQAACHRLVPDLQLPQLLLLLLPTLGALVFWRAARATARQLHAQRRFLRRLPPAAPAVVLGHELLLIDEERPQAFCAGYLKPTIYVSRGACEQLGEAQLRAVLAHERHHQLRRDPLRFCAGRAVAEALFFIPSLKAVGERYAALAELAADEAAIREVGPPPLAAALLRMGQVDAATSTVVAIAPERVDHLAGAPPRWQLSLTGFVTSLLLSAMLVALTLAAGALFAGARLNVVLVMAQSCMPLMTAAALLAAGWGLHLLRPLLPTRS